MQKKFRILGEFIGHLLVGAIMFGMLLLVGGGVNWLVHTVASFSIFDPRFMVLMNFVENVILLADIVFVAWWAIYTMYIAIKDLHR